MEPVAHFDLNRYLGTWYEIARMPAGFENNLIRVTATYSLRNDGKVKVENEGVDVKSLKRKRAIGKAKFAGSADVGYLKVSFFGPFYADYVILELDQDYRYAMVASSNKYLWILSRTPALEKATVDASMEKARSLGFETEKIYFTPHSTQQ
ncbi:MAG TPA: lipocalin family protein [Chitinivibrionales bacterium]|jgi:apolipoprotein D and lipocalin family protein|nr:lipocalin family protein [Chitinivibrionales bacterium]